jgi:hypothetical protein
VLTRGTVSTHEGVLWVLAQLLLSILEYKTAVVRRDLAAAARLLEQVPKDQHNNIARFLDTQVPRPCTTRASAHNGVPPGVPRGVPRGVPAGYP